MHLRVLCRFWPEGPKQTLWWATLLAREACIFVHTSDTKVLPAKSILKYIFLRTTNFTRNLLKKSFFPGDYENGRKSPKYPKKSKLSQMFRNLVFLDFSGMLWDFLCRPQKRTLLWGSADVGCRARREGQETVANGGSGRCFFSYFGAPRVKTFIPATEPPEGFQKGL